MAAEGHSDRTAADVEVKMEFGDTPSLLHAGKIEPILYAFLYPLCVCCSFCGNKTGGITFGATHMRSSLVFLSVTACSLRKKVTSLPNRISAQIKKKKV